MNEATYSPKEEWPFVNYLDTGSITNNRIKTVQCLRLNKDKLPSRARRKVEPGDIVFSTVRPNKRHFGLLRDVPENFLASTGFAVFRAREDIADTGFVYWFLTQDQIVDQLHTIAEHSTSAYPSIRPADIRDIDIDLPPLPEQRAIAHILGALDDKIELNRRMNETLEAMARALFKSWFVDFDPVRARMEGRDTGLPEEVADLFPDRLVDSELGEIPSGWAWESIYNFADVVYGAPFASKQFNTKKLGVPLIRIRDLATHEPGVFTQEVHKKGHLIEPGDIVVGMDGEFRLHIWKGSKAWLNQRVCHFKPKSGVPTVFLSEALRTPLAFFERGKVGTTVIHLGKSDIDTFSILKPRDFLLRAFSDIAQPLLDQTVVNALASRTLAQTRDTLLPKLISGEIRLRDADSIVEGISSCHQLP